MNKRTFYKRCTECQKCGGKLKKSLHYVFATREIDGVFEEFEVCEKCAKEMEKDFDMWYALFKTLGWDFATEEDLLADYKEGKRACC